MQEEHPFFSALVFYKKVSRLMQFQCSVVRLKSQSKRFKLKAAWAAAAHDFCPPEIHIVGTLSLASCRESPGSAVRWSFLTTAGVLEQL